MGDSVDNLALVEHLFRPENADSLIDHLAEDVQLSSTLPDRPPRAVELSGRAEVSRYFESLADLGEFDPFAGPVTFLANQTRDQVAVHGRMRYRVNGSGAAGYGAYLFAITFTDGSISRILDLMELTDVIEPGRAMLKSD